MSAATLGRWELPLWTTYATILTTDPAAIDLVRGEVLAELDAIERACSRFRDDSEVSRIARRPGTPFVLSPLLHELLTEAKRAEEWTSGAVSVTVGAQVRGLGYDTGWAGLPGAEADAVPAWAPLGFDPLAGTYRGRAGELLDFGSIGKAYAAERVATLIAGRAGCGVLVNLGGDIAAAGEPPPGGWRIAVDDHITGRHPVVALRAGAIATSTVVRRAWNDADGIARHHIVDPRTGANPPLCWASVTVAATRAVDANAAATASIVLGPQAPSMLAEHGLAARLAGINGSVAYVGGWPVDRVREAA